MMRKSLVRLGSLMQRRPATALEHNQCLPLTVPPARATTVLCYTEVLQLGNCTTYRRISEGAPIPFSETSRLDLCVFGGGTGVHVMVLAIGGVR